jgi:hypothetical protein
MADEKIKVSTIDGDIVEVDVSVAKKWGPIKAIYECRAVLFTMLSTRFVRS